MNFKNPLKSIDSEFFPTNLLPSYDLNISLGFYEDIARLVLSN